MVLPRGNGDLWGRGHAMVVVAIGLMVGVVCPLCGSGHALRVPDAGGVDTAATAAVGAVPVSGPVAASVCVRAVAAPPDHGAAGAVVVAVPVDDPAECAEGARPAPIAGTERAFRLAYAARLAADPHALDGEIDDCLLGPGPDCARVALLQALWDAAAPAAAEAFRLAMDTVPAVATVGGVSIPDFARGFLIRRAAKEPRARALLWQLGIDLERAQPATTPNH